MTQIKIRLDMISACANHIKSALSAFSIFLFYSCANILSPSGGLRDTTPPTIEKIIPSNKTTNFSGNEVTIHFSENIKVQNLQNEIFISPPLTKPSTLTANKNYVKIKFNETLKENTSYVITVGTGIKDFREGNPLSNSYQMVFSTGEKIDTLEINEKVIDAFLQKPLGGQLIMAYKNFSGYNDSVPSRVPDYISTSDKNGNFSLKYLSPGNYALYSLNDKNKNLKMELSSENIGVNPGGIISLPDSSAREIKLISFPVDTTGPKLQTVKFISNQEMLLEFNEGIRIPRYVREGSYSPRLDFYLEDSLTKERNYPDLIFPNNNRVSEIKLFFKNVEFKKYNILHSYSADSLGNASTIIKNFFPPEKLPNSKVNFKISIGDSGSIHPLQEIVLNADVPFVNEVWWEKFSNIYIQCRQKGTSDSFFSGERINYTYKNNQIEIHPTQEWNEDKEYKLEVRKGLPFMNDSTLDSSYTIRFYSYPYKNYGEILGKISSTTNAPIILQLKNISSGQILVTEIKDSQFHFQFVPPGKYSLYAIIDEDGNGIWTTGRVNPLRMPEKIIYYLQILEVKANWSVEDIEFNLY